MHRNEIERLSTKLEDLRSIELARHTRQPITVQEKPQNLRKALVRIVELQQSLT